ncbi:MAG: pseudouridine synthase [Flammeovirgaceae bacterium]|nr:pseudouridine synthase [Flammeovirgaceae bacterium]
MADNLRYFIINKPYKVLSQYTNEIGNKGLGSIFRIPKGIYAVGRLDLDSEGLLILTNDKKLNNFLLNPENEHKRTYHVEVEGTPSTAALNVLSEGISITIDGKLYRTKKAEVRILKDYDFPERSPAVNRIKHPETSWIEVILTEGKNRQVRKMTAKVGHPTLRLIRVGIESLALHPLMPGQIVMISKKVLYKKLKL